MPIDSLKEINGPLPLPLHIQFIFIEKKKFLGAISLWRMVVPSPKIVINLTLTYKMLHCKGETHRLNGGRDPSLQTEKAYYFM